ncbi:MAG: hypothetical protein MJZ72_09905, partial [Bacteroidales bacterium]|nr:hypothetical protein [Bacteroidales bacterium]
QQHRREVNAANRAGKKADSSVIIRINNGAEEITQPLQEPEKTKTKKFIKPTIEELAAYIKEKKYNVNAQQFFNYYESNGWKVGRNSMKNWKATVQSWNTRGTNSTGTIYQNNADATSEDYSDLF